RTYPFDILSPRGEPVPWEDSPLIRSATTGEAHRAVELRIRDADGKLRPVLCSASPVVCSWSGKRVGAACVFQDITAIKELEELREAWTRIVAHDIRQPLSGMNYALELLTRSLRGKGLGETTMALEHLRVAARRLNAMIDDLFAVSRIATGRLDLKREE